jgi:hypothetical protein
MTLAMCRAENRCLWELDVAEDKVAEFEQRHLTSSPLHADEVPPVAEVADDVIYKHPTEFDTVVRVIEAVAAENAGRVNPNLVRLRIPGHVTPQVVPSTYNQLLRKGRLRATGVKVPNTDRKGRNTNKDIDVYELVEGRGALL